MQNKTIKCRIAHKNLSLMAALSFLVCGCASSSAPVPVPGEDRVVAILNLHAARVANGVEKMAIAEGTIKVQSPDLTATSHLKKNVDNVHSGGTVAGSINIHESNSNAPGLSGQSIPFGLEKSINLSSHGKVYSDDLELVVERICALTGWSKGESTGVPLSPIIVTVPAKNEIAFELLTKLGARLNKAADIIVSEPNKMITISYPVK